VSDPLGIAPAEAEKVHDRAVGWLLEQRDHEAWGEDEQAALDAWLDASPAHLIAYWRAESGWKRTEVLSAMRPFRPQNPPSDHRFRRFATIAASVAVLAIVAMATMYSVTPHYSTYTTPVGGHKTLTLADGSQIELNTDTVVRVAASAGQRDVILDKGEAYFQVTHDAARPFVVTMGNRRITDLGTKFFVRQHSDDVEVGLIEGKARFDATIPDMGKRSVVLRPGETLFATATSVSVKRAAAPQLANDLGWRRGVLIFRHTTLAEAASEFNRYNTAKLVIDDPSVAKLEIRGTFRTADVMRFARIAGKALDLRTASRGNDILISK